VAVAEILVVLVAGLLLIAAATTLGRRLRVAPPLVLTAVGVLLALLPFVPNVEIEPELILVAVLPPLLYSAAVSMPPMEFRREFSAIGGLSVVLVIATSVALGAFFAAVVPHLGLAWGIALGAIISPTDAVATSIVKQAPVPRRVVSMLEGESLLNDATALVLLRTAIAGVAAAFSFWEVVGDLLYAAALAVGIGYVVGRLILALRARVSDATVNTVLSFTAPFIAALPAEHLGASGLVAAVAAGLVTGRRAPRVLSPRHRLSDVQNWRTIELVLEGAIFLTMGLQLATILEDVEREHAGVAGAVGLGALALALVLLVRAAYVTPLLAGLRRRAERGRQIQPQMARIHEALVDPERAPAALRRLESQRSGRWRWVRLDLARFTTRLRRSLADIEYFLQAPLGWREGSVVVWAGMRGAITVAAAQTLPADTPRRPQLILVAFVVAALSLLVQGGTLGAVVRWIRPATPDPQHARDEHERLMHLLASVELEPAVRSWKQERLALIDARRRLLLDARDDGTFDAESLEAALMNLDAEQLGLEVQGDPRE
jgi:monovalent cation/hydrogen antiporter